MLIIPLHKHPNTHTHMRKTNGFITSNVLVYVVSGIQDPIKQYQPFKNHRAAHTHTHTHTQMGMDYY